MSNFIELLQHWFLIEGHELGMYQGLLAAGVAALSILLISKLHKWQWTIAAILLALLTPLALGGFWFSSGTLGISDWDYYFSYHRHMRHAITQYGEFPQWNPFICGGTSAIGDPEFPGLALTFLPTLFMGEQTGLRIAIYLATAIGAIGMLALGKKMSLSVYAAFFAALAFAFGSVNILEIVEGHPNIFSAMWVPWILFFWLIARGREPYKLSSRITFSPPMAAILCAITLAFTFFQGGIYMLMYVGITFIFLIAASHDKIRALKITAVSGLLAVGLAAVKLIPALLWLRQFQDTAYASSASTLLSLHKILLGRYLHDSVTEIIPSQGGGWHEYGAYLGPLVLGLALVAIITYRKKRTIILLTSATILAILISSSGPTLKPLFDQASFLPRSNISRTILFAVLPLSLLAGFGLDAIKKRISPRFQTALIVFVIALVSIDLFTLSYPLSQQAFILPRTDKPVPAAPHPIAYTAFDYKIRHQGIDYTRAYEAAVAGYGTLTYCSVLSPEPAVRTIHDEADNALLLIKNSAGVPGNFSLVSWSPNKVKVAVDAPANADIVLNANYAKGWYVNNQPAQEIGNRVGVKNISGRQELTFKYKAPGLPLGALASLLTLAGICIYAAKAKKRLSNPCQANYPSKSPPSLIP